MLIILPTRCDYPAPKHLAFFYFSIRGIDSSFVQYYHFHMMNDVVRVDELRERIFSHATNKSLASSARVCKLWSKHCLEILWEYLPDVYPLLNVLSPLEKYNLASGYTYRTFYRYRTPPSAQTWSRLANYGKLVRRLEISDIKGNEIMDLHTMKLLAIQRPTFSLTPNLQHIRVDWQSDDLLEYCFLFFNKNVSSLTLCLPTLNWSRFSSVLEAAIFSRASGLRSVNIETRQPLSDGDLENLLTCALPYMKNIKILILPQFSLTPSILSQVTVRLKKLIQNDSLANSIATSNMLPLDPFARTFGSKIEELHVGTTFQSFVMVPSWNFIKLVSLKIDFLLQYENSDSLQNLIIDISEKCPKLQQLSIIISKVRTPILDTAKTISCRPLHALSAIKNLKSFSFQWMTPIVSTNEELLELLNGLPQIENLHLNERPVFTYTGTELTLDVLPSIARVCPNLRRLALFIDCTVSPNIHGPLSQCISVPTAERDVFHNLEFFDLGISPVVRDPFSIARRLYRLLPTKCRLYNSDQVQVPETTSGAIVTTWEIICKNVGESRRTLVVGREEERRRFDRRLRDLEMKIVEAKLRGDKAEERIKELEQALERET